MKRHESVKLMLLLVIQALLAAGCNQVSVYSAMQNIERKQCLDSGVSPVECAHRTSNPYPPNPSPEAVLSSRDTPDVVTSEIDRVVDAPVTTPDVAPLNGKKRQGVS